MVTLHKAAKASLTRANGDKTKLKIIDAAEPLFGQHGFDSVSLRDITNLAGVNLALASYHFKTKENLFGKVVARRAIILCDARIAGLENLSTAEHKNVGAILNVFMEPLFEFQKTGNSGWNAYVRILSRIGEDNRWLGLLKEHFDPTALVFLEALEAALPNKSYEQIVRGFSFVLVTMLQTASGQKRVDSLSNGKVRAADLGPTYRELLAFTTKGMSD